MKRISENNSIIVIISYNNSNTLSNIQQQRKQRNFLESGDMGKNKPLISREALRTFF